MLGICLLQSAGLTCLCISKSGMKIKITGFVARSICIGNVIRKQLCAALPQ